MKVDLKMIENLAKDLEKYHLESLELDLGADKLILKKKGEERLAPVMAPVEVPMMAPSQKEEKLEKKETETKVEAGNYILSPMAGTIYRAAAPGKAAYVKEGDSIQEGDTLCIVEAMKMMNEVKANIAGLIVKILVSDGELVKKDQPLFEIK